MPIEHTHEDVKKIIERINTYDAVVCKQAHGFAGEIAELLLAG